ncbi:GGDEF domain-containing protein [Paraconexibacter antarcticus]|uniref:GGDEF domain-containing protein n=1 Tax=Paraconexibacter antarcticus TaxID=2949664 RepID=A0ABY5DPS4_9ACTN|nr:GGDEF domain-containing protein [Paraconexibacter antarcticus]UTI62787.1 GGDEF domain-containing protein [Paraconexibacter antarcticus]
MEIRLKPVRAATMTVLALALAACGPWLGFWTLAPLAVATLGFTVVDRGIGGARRPELRIAGAWVLSMAAIAVAVAASGGPAASMVAWLVLPVVTLPARFGPRGVAAGSMFAAACIVAVTLGVSSAEVAAAPDRLITPLALLVGVTLLSMALMRSDLHHRSAAVIDPLTGMLNRAALATRAEELSQQAAIVQRPVGVVVGDLDHFKTINDLHGHACGDAVLQEVAYRLRKRLRAFDLAYRLGGEEFLVLVPGADLAAAADVASGLRECIAAAPIAGVAVTMSFGVAASIPGSFSFDDVFADADKALYAAKAAGRDQVVPAVADT